MIWKQYVPQDLQELYEIQDFKHAAAILSNEFPNEFRELCESLREFCITKKDVMSGGGNESQIPKKFSQILIPKGWKEDKLEAKVTVDKREIKHETHKVDYIKNRVAFDLEWNSKDQTFDRDLYAFRAFFDYERISVGVIVTRSDDLNPWFKELGIMHKYGASTTHMGKLLPRLKAGRNGGCPILVFGIKQKLIK